MFAGFLRIADRCSACGFDLKAAVAGSGPAVFIILIVGFIGAFGALFGEMAFDAPPWVLLVDLDAAYGGAVPGAAAPVQGRPGGASVPPQGRRTAQR